MLKIDVHTHSIGSGHAFSTVYELAHAASERKIELIAITDHGPNMKGSSHLEYFSMSERIPRELFGVKILFGCEANIIDYDGNIDIPIPYLKSLDLVITGLHEAAGYPENSTKEQNTAAIINAISKNPVHIIAHPYRPNFPVCVEKIAEFACANNILLEINNSIFRKAGYDSQDELIIEMKKMISVLKQNKGKLIVCSDAHIAYEVGNDSNISKYWDMLGLNEEIIISSTNQLKDYLYSKNYCCSKLAYL